MQHYLTITKALSDETRVRALMSLTEGELCACQIIQLLNLSPSTVSKHMTILQQAGLVQRRKDGRWHYFRLADQSEHPIVRQALQWTLSTLEDEQIIASDTQALCCIRKQDREEMTSCYHTS